ncbi:MAG: dihydrolipoamide acetyltransferase family protein [Anaerolineales bacterium]|jgi:pyruvate dehydrogenase E2 component (dihydrolipoamide acetyltransferase)
MAETISMPKLGFDMAEGTLVRWIKKAGEPVQKGEVLAEIETDKATVEVESTASGVVRRLIVEEGAVVPIGKPIAIVGTAEEKIDEIASAPAQPQPKAAPVASGAPKGEAAVPMPTKVPLPSPTSAAGPVSASPLARRIARENQVNLATIHGTGPGGRIVRRDIETALAGQAVAPAAGVFPPGAGDQTTPISRLRQAIGRRMAESKTTVPHFYVTHEYKMDALMALRAQYNRIVPEDQKLSVNDFIVKAAALTLREFPNLNASLEGASVLVHGARNIGVAVSVEGGLLTVVCREADRKTLGQLSSEMKAMAARVREGKVRSEEIEGSTFSISNLGMYDVENFAAIINPPEAAILAVGSAREMAVVENGLVKSGWRMKATISVDHRVSDGAEAAKFMQALALNLEEPLRLLI